MTAPTTKASAEPKVYSHSEILGVMTGLLAALFTAMISTTIVATALPTIMAALNGTQRQYTWVITASLLTMTISTPIWGKLSDLFNKKFLTQLAIVLFVAGSVLAGCAHEVWLLMPARAIQGIAMGGLIATAQSVMGSIISPRDRGRYSGYMGAVMAVATVSGPLLGGLITDHFGWRWTFFVCVPLAVIALVLIQTKLHLEHTPRRHVKIDYLGSVLLAIAAALPMLWVTFAGTSYDWISLESLAFGIAFLIAAGLTVVVELRVPEPMLPLRVLHNRATILMILGSIAVGVAMFGPGVFLTQYFQLGDGFSPTKAGVMTIPMIVAQMLSATICGQIVSRTGRIKRVMVLGGATMLVGLGGLGFIDHQTSYLQVAIFMAIAGVGIGTLMQNIVLVVQNTVDVTEVGAASAAIAFFRSLGGAIGVSVLGAVLTTLVANNVTDGLRSVGINPGQMSGGGDTKLDISALPGPIQEIVHHAYSDAFGPVFMISAGTAVVTFICVVLLKEINLRTTIAKEDPHDDAPEPAADTLDPAAATSAATAAAEMIDAPRSAGHTESPVHLDGKGETVPSRR
ncbi:MDR family MFS transporter [Gordonia hydrophobica]|uniref:MDR family MFS transporter n=1 Tax=Gordonia hydrophobica TaxID=40516 RepID=A0ABZ2TY24_9ACTN|nr:MDR family MFS transporter [Gordonia hydrophobica]MBM7366962.1 EmrB/QacA subfamily drug resistance transporter [Gordonia hydrophobica]